MKGNIYTQERCWVCNSTMKHDPARHGCYCPTHPKVMATKKFKVVFGRAIQKRFPTYEQASQFLNGLRFKTGEGTFDKRDYETGNPMGFRHLAESYLDFKGRQDLSTYNNISVYINRAIDHFGDRNIKTIRKWDLRQFLYGIEDISEKTRFNHRTQLHDFYYNFLYGEVEVLTLADLPKIPDVPYELGFRALTDLDTQQEIIDQVKDNTYHINEKIWLGIDMLAMYNNIRPADLLRLKEADIDIENGIITFWRPSKSKKNRNPKVLRIRLLEYHIAEIAGLMHKYPAVPAMKFFRHHGGVSGVAVGEPFGKRLMYKHWKAACDQLGIEGLDMYGGTRHSTTTATAILYGRDKARQGSGHDTDKAFDRYCQVADDSFDVATLMAKRRGKVVKLRKRKK